MKQLVIWEDTPAQVDRLLEGARVRLDGELGRVVRAHYGIVAIVDMDKGYRTSAPPAQLEEVDE